MPPIAYCRFRRVPLAFRAPPVVGRRPRVKGGPAMSQPVGPTVARERLRQRLRELREISGLATGVVAARMDWSPSKLSRIEKGDVTVQPLEVRALLTLYGHADEAEALALTGLA